MVIVHSKSYKGIGVDKLIHKDRLKKIVAIIKNLKLKDEGKWADFGCSDGFYFDRVRDYLPKLKHWELYGFDHEDKLLKLAEKRKLQKAVFDKFDLNVIDKTHKDEFDFITCFETMEHVGNYKNAFENIYLSCKKGGIILLAVPNETGLQGIAKFVGRKMLRKNAYGNFFKQHSEWAYFMSLLKGGDIEVFRNSEALGWGPHLGFNYKNLEKYISNKYISNGKIENIKKTVSCFGFNIIYILKKVDRGRV